MSHLFEPIEPAAILWRDGLPYSSLFNDIYFSTEDGHAETRHVFIEGNDLVRRFQSLGEGEVFVIGELGFGSGLNFLATLLQWEQHAPKTATLYFISAEKHPFCETDLKRALDLWPMFRPGSQALLNQYPPLTPGIHSLEFCQGRVRLMLMFGDALSSYRSLLYCGDKDLENQVRPWCVDAWYLDGFSPAKNEQMWQERLFQVIALLSGPNTTLATFSVARQVKDALNASGFEYIKARGFGHKREMIKARFTAPRVSLKDKGSPWHIGRFSVGLKKERDVVVIGAGLAGAFCAHYLAEEGMNVKVLDAAPAPATGASGNPRAVIFPNLSAYDAPLTHLMLSAYLYATRLYRTMIGEGVRGEQNGIALLSESVGEHERQWLKSHPMLGQYLSPDALSEKIGVPSAASGIFVPMAGWIDSPMLIRYLLNHERITFVGHSEVLALVREGQQWQVNGYLADDVIVTGGYASRGFQQTAHLPLKAIRGQMSAIKSTPQSQSIRVPVCAEGHVLPAVDGVHYFGASFKLNNDSVWVDEKEHLENLHRLQSLKVSAGFSSDIVHGWAGVRGATPDYMPLVGPVPMESPMRTQFAVLRKNTRQWVGHSGEFYPGLYVCSGFGSRGVTTIPLCARALVNQILHHPVGLSTKVMQAMSPARFIIKNIARGK